MNIGIYTNLNKDLNGSTAMSLISVLEKKQISYKYFAESGEDYNKFDNLDKFTDEIDLLVAFGGDGTMLNIVPHCADKNIPILGVNLGHLGFLTETDKNGISSCIEKIIKGDYFCEQRSMLEVNFDGYKFTALNEVVLSKKDNSNICTTSIDINNVRADNVRADGVMVSTPTGSTGYSLSCNGSILSPDLNAFIINAICPHSLHFCPIVVSGDSIVELKSDSDDMRLTVDGKIIPAYTKSSNVIVKKHKNSATFIRFDKNQSFYSKLIKKLSYWGN